MAVMRLVIAGASLCAALSFSPAHAATLTAGFDASVLSDQTVAARYRGQATSNEHYVGVNNLSASVNRSEEAHTWVNGVIPFTFTFDSTTGIVSSLLDSTDPADAITFGGPTDLVSNALQLTLSNRSKSTTLPAGTFQISDLSVNGEALPDLSCAAFCDWMVTDYEILPLLTVTGNINFAGTMDSNDQERVRFQITSSAIAPVPLPPAAAMLIVGVAGLYGMRRRKR